jgi:hypothetical protein
MSRPHPCVVDRGERNCPSAERGPKLIIAMTQPQMTMTAGVRQLRRLTAGDMVDIE